LIGGLLTAVCIAAYLISPPFVTFLNLKLTDAMWERTIPKRSSGTVVAVAIDENSLGRFGQWPWPRYRLALLVEKLGQMGARSIGLDFIMAEPDRLSFSNLLEMVRRDRGYQLEIKNIPKEFKDNDAMLAGVLAKWPCVLGFEFCFDTPESQASCRLHPVKPIIDQPPPDEGDLGSFPQATSVVCNLEYFSKAVSASGFLNGIPDLDGVLRRLPLLIRYGESLYPNLALATVMRVAPSVKNRFITHRNGQKYIHLDRHTIPTDSNGNLYIYFPKDADRIAHVSAEDILRDRVPQDAIRDKIVFVGLTASGLSPMYRTPAGAMRSALEVQAQAAETIVSQTHLQRSPGVQLSEIGLTVILAAMFCFCIVRFGFLTNFLLGTLGILGLWLGSVHVFQASGIMVSPLLPAAGLLANGIGLTTFKYWRQQRVARSNADSALCLLKSSENQLDSIIKTIPDIVFRLDPSGRITFISPAILKYEQAPEAMRGRHILDIVHPEDRDAAAYRINERRTGARATSDCELRLMLFRKTTAGQGEGGYFSISAEGVYAGDKPGKDSFLGTQGIARDISKRKQLENRLEQSRKMEAVGNLAAGVAHDLNNILSGLFSYPELLLIDLPTESPLRSGLETIQKSGQKAAAIVQDMLCLSRSGAAMHAIVNLNDVVAEFLSAPEFKRIREIQRDIRVSTHLSDDLMNIKGSKIHLTKAIMNLILNAAEAMPAGGTITVLTQNRYVDTALSGYEVIPEGEYVVLSIGDEGVGIAPNDLFRIFEPFYTRKRMGRSGTGLGMTVVWAAVKDHKGYVDLQSREGEGTRFDIFLPATRDAAVAGDRKAVLEDYTGTERILVVDDVPEQREITERMLRKLGYRVASVPSGEAAVDYVQSNPADLLVLDMILEPGIDGLETYRRIISIRPGQKAIIASGFSESERVKALQSLGAGAYIRKPYTLETIGLAVRKELSRK